MSLGICTTTSEGLVLAADSRQTYLNRKGAWRIGSEAASKLFQLSKATGMVVAGPAFLPEGGIDKNISKFVEMFKNEHELGSMRVSEIASLLHDFFKKRYDYKTRLEQIEPKLRAQLEAEGNKVKGAKNHEGRIELFFTTPDGKDGTAVAGIDRLQFLLAGYNPDNSHEVFVIEIPGGVVQKRDSIKKGLEYGADWIGQGDVVSRMILGVDPRMGNVPFVGTSILQLGKDEVAQQLRGLEYVIQWGAMTLQDGVDFSVLSIETTKAIQRFSDGVLGNPGDVPGVGGPVDVAVITPAGFEFVTKKEIKI
jgi:hypothetical protein